MILLRWATIERVVDERAGAVELTVRLSDAEAPEAALAYPALVGGVAAGDRVLLNTTAVALGLGTGGVHFVVAVDRPDPGEPAPSGRTMKLRYAPHQLAVRSAEEAPETRPALEAANGLDGLPVVWVPLHSLVAPAVAGARAAGARRVVYVMTDGAALAAPLSRLVATLRRRALLDAVVSTGQAFGGDLETVNVFTGLLAARSIAGADVVVVGDGPGNTGTNTVWGATDIESAMALNATAILGGRPVAALRISFADPRERHRVVSHHSLTAVGRVALTPVHVAVPSLEGAEREAVWDALRTARLDERHQLVEVTGKPALDALADAGIDVESMGRSVDEDPAFFLAGGAAGVLAGRMAAGDHAWRHAEPRARGSSS